MTRQGDCDGSRKVRGLNNPDALQCLQAEKKAALAKQKIAQRLHQKAEDGNGTINPGLEGRKRKVQKAWGHERGKQVRK